MKTKLECYNIPKINPKINPKNILLNKLSALQLSPKEARMVIKITQNNLNPLTVPEEDEYCLLDENDNPIVSKVDQAINILRELDIQRNMLSSMFGLFNPKHPLHYETAMEQIKLIAMQNDPLPEFIDYELARAIKSSNLEIIKNTIKNESSYTKKNSDRSKCQQLVLDTINCFEKSTTVGSNSDPKTLINNNPMFNNSSEIYQNLKELLINLCNNLENQFELKSNDAATTSTLSNQTPKLSASYFIDDAVCFADMIAHPEKIELCTDMLVLNDLKSYVKLNNPLNGAKIMDLIADRDKFLIATKF